MEVREENIKVCVIGGGSWGTALAKVLSEKGIQVVLLVRRKSVAEAINRTKENPEYLPGIKLPPTLRAETHLNLAVEDASAVIWTIPSHTLNDYLVGLSADQISILKSIKRHILGIKGIDVTTGKWPSEILQDYLGLETKVYVLGGPSFAKEVAKGLPTAVVVASQDRGEWVQRLFAHRYFRVYRNYDPKGVECAGALKNVIAIAGGICDGLNLGANARASLITRGLLELIRLGEALSAKRETFYGLAGLGDLVLTCTSNLSRNYRVGFLLARGLTLEKALAEVREVAEGIRTAKVVKDLASKYNLDLPICTEVYKILYEGLAPVVALESLLSRELKEEFT